MNDEQLIQNLLNISNNVNYWLEDAEKKLAYVTSFFSILTSICVFFIDKFQNNMFIMIGVSILFFSSIISIYLLLISFKPIEDCKFFKKIKGSTDNNNLIFYKHISKYDFNSYKEALSKKYNIDDIDNNQYALDIINQILINSKTAVRKYNIADSAIKILMIGFSSYLIMLLLYFVFKYF